MRRFAYSGAVDLSDELTDVDGDDDDDDVTWHVLLGPGDVRAVSLDQLDYLYRLDAIDDLTYVWKPGMRTWQPLFLVIGPTDEEEEEQFWSVLVAPGEVKQLSLEQLDDWYRLDVIDARTLVWQEGMASWQPLGLVAGIEAQPQRSPASRAMPFVPSSAPVTFTLPAPAQAPRAGLWLLRLALAAGLVVTVYRNDLITSVARSAHQEAAFDQLEQRIGGPGFGTVRAVETLLEHNSLQLPEVRVPELLVAREVARQVNAEAVPPSSSPSTAKATAPAPSASPADAKPSPATSAGAPSAQSAANGLGSADASRTKHARGKGTKSGRATLDNIIPGTRTSPRGGGSEYDPLNPNL
jgi:hypothetical protein